MLPHEFPAWDTVYHAFRQWQRETWIEDVRQASIQQLGNGIIQYLSEGGVTVVDYTAEKTHSVTKLSHEEGYTLDYIAADLPTISKQDNVPVLRWNRAIRA